MSEELIQVAAKRLYFDHSTDRIAETAPEIMALCEKFAKISFAVFEEAQGVCQMRRWDQGFGAREPIAHSCQKGAGHD